MSAPIAPAATSAGTPEIARVIVKYKASAGSAQILSASAQKVRAPQLAQALGARVGLALVDGRSMDSQTQIVHARGISSAALAQRLAQDSGVAWAVPDRRVRARWVPNDTSYGGQWYLHAPTTSAAAAINAAAAWDVARGNRQVVAVLDTGITAHLDLPAQQFLPGRNMVSLNTAAEGNAAGLCIAGNGACRPATTSPDDPGDWVSQADLNNYPDVFSGCSVEDSSWHGTQVAGIVGAATNNSMGVAGIATEAKILPVRVLGKCSGWESDIADGILWAAGVSVDGHVNPNPATVINLSLGGTASDGPCGQAYQEAIDAAIAKGVVVVVAAGNDGLGVGAPGNCKGVITVGAVQHAGAKASYSSLGPKVTVSAPGGDCSSKFGPCGTPILTTFNDGLTSPAHGIYTDAVSNIFQGTSFSTPMAAATAALMLSANPKLTPTQVSALLQTSARPFPKSGLSGVTATCADPAVMGVQNTACYCTTSTCGAGMLDAAAAVTAAAGVVAVDFTASPASPQAGQPVSLTSNVSAPASRTINKYQWEITAGRTLASLTSATDAATAVLATTGSGSVTVQLTVTDDLNRSVMASKVLTILPAAITPAPAPAPTQSGGGGGTWTPLWSLGLLLAALALPGRTARRRR